MWEIILWSGVFLVSIFTLIKASDFFAESAEKIGVFVGISPFVVGVTIVAFATSLPELVTSLIAVAHGSTEIVAGNVVGSNIANIFLVLGITAILGKKLEIHNEIINDDLPLFLGSAFLFAVFIWPDKNEAFGRFNIYEALISIAGIVLYLVYSVQTEAENIKNGKMDAAERKDEKEKLGTKPIFILIASSAMIFVGANFTIDSVIHLSEIFAVGKEIVAVSAIALGTSLPELVVSISLVQKGNGEMAVGNVLGSNIFNSFIVMGIPGLFAELIIPKSIVMVGMPIMVIATLLYLFITLDKEITRWEGWLLVMFYVVFIGKIFELF